MIRKLQIKFVIIIMAIMIAVLICIFGAMNIIMLNSTNERTVDTLKKIAEHDGKMRGGGMLKPPDDTLLPKWDEPPPQLNFSVKISDKGTITEVLSDRNQIYTEEEVGEYVTKAVHSGKTMGSIGTFKYYIEQKPYGKIVVFVDNSMQLSSTIRLFWISIVVGFIALIAIFIISLYLSRWAIKPVEKAYEAQKQFVADASHELKTPLTVISANADVLLSEIEDNKWLRFIKSETRRMSELVNNLLYLAKSDAVEDKYTSCEFDLSNSILGTVLPFESVCYENHKTLSLDIKEGIQYKGDEQRLMQVVIILLDNAIKNSDENGTIKVSLLSQKGKKIISVYNTGEGILETDRAKIFDRFYRGDSSRARQTGGYGLGLSIAKTIIKAHKGKLTVESENGRWALFIATL